MNIPSGGDPDVLDVAIVGGGIGGVYAAWRLLHGEIKPATKLAEWCRYGRPHVAVFERSDRVGGRLLSARPPRLGGLTDTTVELGGMRYVVPDQTRISTLVEKVLGLSFHEQVVDRPENVAFLRDRRLRSCQLGSPGMLPYALRQHEATWLANNPSASPADLIGRVLTQLMPDIPARLASHTLRAYLASVELPYFPGGRSAPLWMHGFWNVLASQLSPEAYDAAKATIGYDCLGSNCNALDLTAEYFGFTPKVRYRVVNGGYERVPWLLADKVRQRGCIHFRQELLGFDRATLPDGSTGLRLTISDHTHGTPKHRDVLARTLILALPRRAIELLRPDGPLLGHPKFHYYLRSVSPIPLFKLFLHYKTSWWQATGVTQGRSLTDLPMRQCWYWPMGADPTTVAKPDDPGLIMAYDDLLNVSFWAGLDTRRSAHQHTTSDDMHQWRMFETARAPTQPAATDPFDNRLLSNWLEHGASEAMVMELHRQLGVMHGVENAPFPVDAAYMDWSRDPYGGGVHLWNSNYNSQEYLHRMIQPERDLPCYICGEAYSTNQTWVEGALQTADLVLEKLGMAALGDTE